ncbi:hypothetical protein V1511DRAFT_508306 [Dipodascopsis uninucleata]
MKTFIEDSEYEELFTDDSSAELDSNEESNEDEILNGVVGNGQVLRKWRETRGSIGRAVDGHDELTEHTESFSEHLQSSPDILTTSKCTSDPHPGLISWYTGNIGETSGELKIEMREPLSDSEKYASSQQSSISQTDSSSITRISSSATTHTSLCHNISCRAELTDQDTSTDKDFASVRNQYEVNHIRYRPNNASVAQLASTIISDNHKKATNSEIMQFIRTKYSISTKSSLRVGLSKKHKVESLHPYLKSKNPQ